MDKYRYCIDARSNVFLSRPNAVASDNLTLGAVPWDPKDLDPMGASVAPLGPKSINSDWSLCGATDRSCGSTAAAGLLRASGFCCLLSFGAIPCKKQMHNKQ